MRPLRFAAAVGLEQPPPIADLRTITSTERRATRNGGNAECCRPAQHNSGGFEEVVKSNSPSMQTPAGREFWDHSVPVESSNSRVSVPVKTLAVFCYWWG